MRRFAAVFLTSLAVLGTAIAGFAFAAVAGGSSPTARHATKVTNVTVHAGEYYFNLDTGDAMHPVPAGTVVFTVINDGDVTHDFQISNGSQTFSTPILSKGQTATLTVDFPAAGQYNFLCTLGEHAIYGMQGFFYVTGTTTTATTRTTTTTTTTTTPRKTTVGASETEFKIKLSGVKTVKKYKTVRRRVKINGKWVIRPKKVLVSTTQTVPAGDVTFNVTNNGKIAHNFAISGHSTLVLAAGKSETLTVSLAKGRYPYQCTITGHAALGMKGVLVAV